jgi:thimet oligopeptidase
MTMKKTTLGLVLALGAGCAHAPEQDAEPAPAPAATAVAPTPAPAPAPAVKKTFDEMDAVDVPLLRWKYTPEEIAQLCDQAEKTATQKLAALVAVPDAQRTFANSFNAYEQSMTDYSDAVTRLSFMKEVHPDAKVREAAAACEERAGKFYVQVGARKDLYLALKGYLSNAGASEKLDAVDQRLIEITMRDFRRNGLELSDANREKLVQIRSRLAELGTQYSSNLDNDTTSYEVTKAELAGMPDNFLARLKKAADGKYIVTTKYPDYYPVMENCSVEATRKKAWLAFNSRETAKNLPLLAEAVAKRDEAAKLLGFATHADFVTEDRMAKSGKAVVSFLDRLKDELKPGRDALNAKMLTLKRKETHDKKAQLQTWDWRYFLNEIRKSDYAIDDEQVRAYFPADKVLAGMFQVYQTLFGVKFDEVPNTDNWADGVKLYTMHDAQSGKLLAKFYIDLFPRPGKYGHAASFPIGVAREVSAGYQIPLSALVVNFNPPENGKVAHLSVDEVETLFHEFGHIVHGSLTTARYNTLAGTNVDTDFVEAPSQMLENWVYQPEVLALITQDPKDPSKTMPADLASHIAKARTYNAGVRYTRQVFLASFDVYIHTHGASVDIDKADHELREQITGYPANKDEHFAASFGHLMGGYDAGYYGYLWSKVFADDMFTRFEKEGVLNPKTGHDYRNAILAMGRVQEPDVLLRKFLGRDPDEHAFLRLLGIEGQATAAPAKP